MTNRKLTVEELLNDQEKAAFRATLEAVENKPELVKVTPWTEAAGCLCHLAVNLNKSSLEGVTPSGDVHVCCGKTLKVVELHFKQGGSMPLDDLFQQLSAAAAQSAPSHEKGVVSAMFGPGQGPKGDPPPWGRGPPPWRPEIYPRYHPQAGFSGNPLSSLCESNYARCLQHCAYSPNQDECACLCQSSRQSCHGRPAQFC